MVSGNYKLEASVEQMATHFEMEGAMHVEECLVGPLASPKPHEAVPYLSPTPNDMLLDSDDQATSSTTKTQRGSASSPPRKQPRRPPAALPLGPFPILPILILHFTSACRLGLRSSRS